eukprot:Rmarinus@m.16994
MEELERYRREAAERTCLRKSINRSEWIHAAVHAHKDEYSRYHDLKLVICTWNVKGLKDKPLDWCGFLDPAEHGYPDIYVVGLQETVKRAAQNLPNVETSHHWISQVKGGLHGAGGSGAAYAEVAHKRHKGLLLVCLAKEQLVASGVVQGVGVAALGAGTLKKGGAVGLRIRVHSSTYCFVNTQCIEKDPKKLGVAYSKTMYRLLREFGDISRDSIPLGSTDTSPVGKHVGVARGDVGETGVGLNGGGGDSAGGSGGDNASQREESVAGPDVASAAPGIAPSLSGLAAASPGSSLNMSSGGSGQLSSGRTMKSKPGPMLGSSGSLSSLNLSGLPLENVWGLVAADDDDDDDGVFFFGDLNFRLSSEVSSDQAHSYVLNKDFGLLFQYDELHQRLMRDDLFQTFQEGPVTFGPTYKLEPGTTRLDLRDGKKRPPAWRSRILWKGEEISLATSSYRSHGVVGGTQFPVSARFCLRVREENAEAKASVRKAALKAYDSRENRFLPSIRVCAPAPAISPIQEEASDRPTSSSSSPPLCRRHSRRSLVGEYRDGALHFLRLRGRWKNAIARASFVIENTGSVVAKFTISAPDDDARWLVSLRPSHAIFMPGSSVTVRVEVTPGLLWSRAGGSAILVVSLEDGGDSFVPIVVENTLPGKEDSASLIQALCRGFIMRKQYRQMKDSREFSRVRRRLKIVNEIISTEESYVSSLACTCEAFMIPMRSKQIVSPAEVVKLFSVVESLWRLHEHFLSQLTKVQSTAVGEVFLSLGEYLKVYTMYCRNHEAAQRVLQDCRERKAVRRFLTSAAEDPRCRGNDLAALLIMPVQRIPRYVLLLTDLLKHTEKSHVDEENLRQALRMVKGLGEHVNEAVRVADQMQWCIQLQQKVVDLSTEIVAPHRHVRFSGTVRVAHVGGKPPPFSSVATSTHVGSGSAGESGGGGGVCVSGSGPTCGVDELPLAEMCSVYVFNDRLVCVKPFGGGAALAEVANVSLVDATCDPTPSTMDVFPLAIRIAPLPPASSNAVASAATSASILSDSLPLPGRASPTENPAVGPPEPGAVGLSGSVPAVPVPLLSSDGLPSPALSGSSPSSPAPTPSTKPAFHAPHSRGARALSHTFAASSVFGGTASSGGPPTATPSPGTTTTPSGQAVAPRGSLPSMRDLHQPSPVTRLTLFCYTPSERDTWLREIRGAIDATEAAAASRARARHGVQMGDPTDISPHVADEVITRKELFSALSAVLEMETRNRTQAPQTAAGELALSSVGEDGSASPSQSQSRRRTGVATMFFKRKYEKSATDSNPGAPVLSPRKDSTGSPPSHALPEHDEITIAVLLRELAQGLRSDSCMQLQQWVQDYLRHSHDSTTKSKGTTTR